MCINLIMWRESKVGWENLEIMKEKNESNDERKRINYYYYFFHIYALFFNIPCNSSLNFYCF